MKRYCVSEHMFTSEDVGAWDGLACRCSVGFAFVGHDVESSQHEEQAADDLDEVGREQRVLQAVEFDARINLGQ